MVRLSRRALSFALTCAPLAVAGRSPAAPLGGAALPPPAWRGPLAGGMLTRYAAVAADPLLARNVDIWTPRDAPRPDAPCAVIYLSDGQNLFRAQDAFGGQTWGVAEALQRLIDMGVVRPAMLVGVWNTPRRGQEYAPIGGQSREDLAVLAQEWGGPLVSDRYLTFLVDTLKPAVDATYATRPGRSDTFVMGSSMGGLIALDAVLLRPKVFGAAACLSTHWPVRRPDRAAADPVVTARIASAWLAYVDARLPPAGAPDAPRLYFDHGDQGLDAGYGPFQVRMDAILTSHGYRPGRDYESLAFPGATHNEASWRARIDSPLTFLLGR